MSKGDNKPKYYLAHAIKDRHAIRDWELRIEEKFPVELVNPFYDASEIGNMGEIDAGKKGIYDASFDSAEIVEGDLDLIRKADGMVAVVTNSVSVGTNMEIFFNGYVLKKPTHIIVENPELLGHSWLRHMSGISSGKIYKSREEFEQTFLGKLKSI